MVVCGFYSDSFMGYTAKAYYQNKTDDRIDVILDKGSINGFECTPEGAALLEPHSNAYVDIRWQEFVVIVVGRHESMPCLLAHNYLFSKPTGHSLTCGFCLLRNRANCRQLKTERL